MKTRTKDNRGMTLLEIIIALAILGIIAVSILALFTSSFSFIAKAGNRSVATYDANAQVEQAIVEKDTTGSKIQIEFEDHSTIDAPGKLLHKTAVENGVTVDIYYFQPKN